MLVLKESNIQIYRIFFYVLFQYDIKIVTCIHTAT